MSLLVDEQTGTITLYQGDTGSVTFVGLNPERNYDVYFAIYNKNRQIFGEEVCQSVINSDRVTLELPSTLTDRLTVPKNKEFETYYYGVKLCEIGTAHEDTLFIGNSSYGDSNEIIVYPKKVEGILS